MGKIDQLKIGLSLISKIEPILKELVQIKENQTHGKQELRAINDKFIAVYVEYFETESDATHFVKFCNQVYMMKKDQLPPNTYSNCIIQSNATNNDAKRTRRQTITRKA